MDAQCQICGLSREHEPHFKITTRTPRQIGLSTCDECGNEVVQLKVAFRNGSMKIPVIKTYWRHKYNVACGRPMWKFRKQEASK